MQKCENISCDSHLISVFVLYFFVKVLWEIMVMNMENCFILYSEWTIEIFIILIKIYTFLIDFPIKNNTF